MFFRIALALALAFTAADAMAQDGKVGALTIEQVYSRPSAGRNGAAYVTIVNAAPQADKLVRVASPRSARVEMHTMTMDGDIMRMRQVADIDVPPQGKVEMQPGQGLHIMLIGLKGPLTAGERFPLSLAFERAGSIDVMVEVRNPAAPKKP